LNKPEGNCQPAVFKNPYFHKQGKKEDKEKTNTE
jgi:hypothetical protein